MPASPYRRLDSGAVGSLSAGSPLQIFDPRDMRLLDTAEFLLSRCMVNGGFYQDIIHSGVNPYLTLHIAQVLLRARLPQRATRSAEGQVAWLGAVRTSVLGIVTSAIATYFASQLGRAP